MQSRIIAVNPTALWIPCTAHSINLVGISALETSSIIDYFDFMKRLYIFFTPPRRLNIMKKQLNEKHLKVPKRLCTTRWSSHADATDASMNGYLICKELIKKFIENKECYLNVFL